jgi:hypothetical protein
MVAIIYSCVTWPVGRDGQESPDPPPRSERRAACGRHPFPLSTARVASRSFSGQGISIGKWPIRGHLIIWRSFSKNSGSAVFSHLVFLSEELSFSEVSDLRDYSGAMAVLRAPMDFVWMSLLQFDGYTFEPNFILCLTLGFFLSVPLDTRPTAGCSCSLLAKTCFGVAVGGTRVSPSSILAKVEFACSTILFCSLLYRLCVWTGCPPARLLSLSRAIYQCRSFVAPPPLLSRMGLVSPASQRPVLAHAWQRTPVTIRRHRLVVVQAPVLPWVVQLARLPLRHLFNMALLHLVCCVRCLRTWMVMPMLFLSRLPTLWLALVAGMIVVPMDTFISVILVMAQKCPMPHNIMACAPTRLRHR